MIFDIVLDDDFLYCVMGYFPNDVALSFDVVYIIFSVCVIFFCVLGGGSVWFLGRLGCMTHAWNWIFYRCVTMKIVV